MKNYVICSGRYQIVYTISFVSDRHWINWNQIDLWLVYEVLILQQRQRRFPHERVRRDIHAWLAALRREHRMRERKEPPETSVARQREGNVCKRTLQFVDALVCSHGAASLHFSLILSSLRSLRGLALIHLSSTRKIRIKSHFSRATPVLIRHQPRGALSFSPSLLAFCMYAVWRELESSLCAVGGCAHLSLWKVSVGAPRWIR